MFIDIETDEEFIKFSNFLFSFDFECKEIIQRQLQSAIVKKEKTDYHIAFRFYVDASADSLPGSFNGIPVTIEIVSDNDYTMVELFAAHRFIVELRVYNINGTKLSITDFPNGEIRF